jgi:hypothetical protein
MRSDGVSRIRVDVSDGKWRDLNQHAPWMVEMITSAGLRSRDRIFAAVSVKANGISNAKISSMPMVASWRHRFSNGRAAVDVRAAVRLRCEPVELSTGVSGIPTPERSCL